jgi:deoxyribose-phosphate aldolase
MTLPEIDLASYIDHALLSIKTTEQQVQQGCNLADYFHFPTICVYPCAVRYAAELLYSKKTGVCAVIGFPTGMSTTNVKLHEAIEAVENGAAELDLMINLGWLQAGELDKLHAEVAQICQETGKPIKAILETALLDDKQKTLAAEICLDAGVAYLKTSTGFFGGATVEDVQLLAKITKGKIGIKASGGIRTLEKALELIQAGATRLGTSSGPELIELLQEQQLQGVQ